jgi:hypothetical protein
MLSLRASFSPAHPLARRDVPLALARAFRGRALREQTFLLFPLPTAAETTIVGRRVETEAALTGEGGTQLAAARDRCSF